MSLPAISASKGGRGFKFIVVLSVVLLCLTLGHFISQKTPLHLFRFGKTKHSIYYERETPSFFPPVPSNATDLCTGFPVEKLEYIQVIIKTGIGEADKAKAHLAATSSCLENAIVVSDVEQEVGEYHIINILADLPTSYQTKDPDFAAYVRQQGAINNGSSTEYTHNGWKMDRLKFLPMVDYAYKMNPNAEWYVFTESDVYIFWDSMFRLLFQYNPSDKLYLGAPVHGSYGRDFAYGGASFIISQGLMHELAGHGRSLAVEFEQMAIDDCCGDAVLAYATMKKTGVRLQGVYPMLSGEEIGALGLDGDTWCMPIVSVHRAGPDVMEPLWKWERTRPYTKKPLVYSDLLYYTHPFLRNETERKFWDNLSDVAIPETSRGNSSVQECAKACRDHHRCFQYTYTKGECRFGYHVRLGHAVNELEVEFVSGWDKARIKAHGFNPEDPINLSCDKTYWRELQRTPYGVQKVK